jgi:hypothetical protein
MVFVEGDDYRTLRRPGDDPAQFRAPVRLPRRQAVGLDAAITDGLVAWYRFEDSSNTAIDYTNELGVGADQTAFDGTVNGASFVENGGVQDVVSGPNSGAYEFDGVDDDIVLPSSSAFAFTTDVTLTAWVRPDTFSLRTPIIAKARNTRGNETEMDYYLGAGGGSVFAGVSDGSDVLNINGGSLTTGIYQHLAMTYNGQTLRVFLNGTQVNSGSLAVTTLQDKFDVHIGGSESNNSFYDGVIDAPRIYNRVLSASEINQIYQNTDPDQ